MAVNCGALQAAQQGLGRSRAEENSLFASVSRFSSFKIRMSNWVWGLFVVVFSLLVCFFSGKAVLKLSRQYAGNSSAALEVSLPSH